MPHARPTTDRAKEALFNIIDQSYYFEDITVLDLYAGLGSISLEFASRGTQSITSVEFNRKSINYISEISKKLDLSLNLISQKVEKYLKYTEETFDVIFADPPYNNFSEIGNLIETITQGKFIKAGGIFILEHQTMTPIDHPKIFDKRNYGQSTFSFFKFDEA